ncbi:MAG TPA: helix-turn-helix domain-containing protein [Solirubrobacteraceae bacterium]|jgi:DNA-binding HxlR family transcriptional regulator|nr:helix-turn-helix domain-containing protein [Solirubrobacteraceae bacterium]
MNSRRTYADSCGIARALDIVGERWALLVVRELVLGPKRFTDLRAGLPRAGPDMLAARLRELEAAGVVRRRTLPAPAASRVYELTEWGAELAPALLALGRWGSRAPLPPAAPPLGIDAAIMALETTFAPADRQDPPGPLAVGLGDQVFTLTVDAAGGLVVTRGAQGGAPARIDTETATLAAVVWHGHPLQAAIDDGTLALTGDRALADAWLAAFAAPVPVPWPVPVPVPAPVPVSR